MRVGVGAEALALAGELGGDEVERVELGVGVRQRGAGLAALVDDHVHVGGVRRGRACRARQASTAAADLLGGQLGQRADRLRRADDHLVGAGGGRAR